MHRQPDFLKNLQNELANGRLWVDRSIVLALCHCCGPERGGLHPAGRLGFCSLSASCTGRVAGRCWCGHRPARRPSSGPRAALRPGAAGSGIPQVMAALDPAVDDTQRSRFVSLRLTVAKNRAGRGGLSGGPVDRARGPPVQVAAGVMQHARRWLGPHSGITGHGLLVAGGAAGIAAASMRPLAGWCLPLRSCRASSNRAAAA